jgi:hypothetical protein
MGVIGECGNSMSEKIVHYVIRSKNEVLRAEAQADKAAKAHKTIFAPNNIYYFFFKRS